MDELIKNIKKKLSVDNIVGFMKESKEEPIEESGIKEEDVRKTLEKIDPNSVIDLDDIAAQLEDMGQKTKDEPKNSSKNTDGGKSGILSKASQHNTPPEEEDGFSNDQGIFGFID